jgi:hypothetical protein
VGAGPLTWVQTLTVVTTWSELKSQKMSYYQPLNEELRARDALHVQRVAIEEYSKAYKVLEIKVPQKTLE